MKTLKVGENLLGKVTSIWQTLGAKKVYIMREGFSLRKILGRKIKINFIMAQCLISLVPNRYEGIFFKEPFL